MQSVFENENIHGVRRFVSEYQFFVGELPQMITVRFYQSLDRNSIEFEQSHFINTPLQIDAYRTSAPYGDDQDDALRLAVGFCLVQWYEQAIREGHQPDESWLVPNPRFHNLLSPIRCGRRKELDAVFDPAQSVRSCRLLSPHAA
jgi:hypothetical protein